MNRSTATAQTPTGQLEGARDGQNQRQEALPTRMPCQRSSVFAAGELLMVARQGDRARIGSGEYSKHRRKCNVVLTIKDSDLRLKYQPKLDLGTGRVVGVEALMRWHHPPHGLLEADEFIPLAEEVGIIAHLDAWAIQESCRQAHVWQERGEFSGSVAVNVSAPELLRPDFVDTVRNALERHRVDPGRLILEITESCAIDDLERTLKTLADLGAMGVRTALDDFGTGYSSLASLKYLPISEVKVDSCFVKDIADCDQDVAIVVAIIAMAKAKGACVIAEGVETAKQLEVLASLGCDAVQGYLIGRPMEPEELVRAVIELEKGVGLYDGSRREGGLSSFLFGDAGCLHRI
jgi:EAL domain-containing protein (putative c-di-GMP-specific phosphodiesterase class I)